MYLCNTKPKYYNSMKNTNAKQLTDNQIIEYLTNAAAHEGYCWDGVKIKPGTAVTCLKTIARETGLSYYRVKKCIARLVEAGRITITRHKCFAIITFRATQPQAKQTAEQPKAQPTPYQPSITHSTATATSPTQLPSPTQPILNRAERRRLARQAAKDAARRGRRI